MSLTLVCEYYRQKMSKRIFTQMQFFRMYFGQKHGGICIFFTFRKTVGILQGRCRFFICRNYCFCPKDHGVNDFSLIYFIWKRSCMMIIPKFINFIKEIFFRLLISVYRREKIIKITRKLY